MIFVGCGRFDSDFIQLGAAMKVSDFFKNQTFTPFSIFDQNITLADEYQNFYVYDQDDSSAENKNPMGFSGGEGMFLKFFFRPALEHEDLEKRGRCGVVAHERHESHV